MNSTKWIANILLLTLQLFSCRKLADVPPPVTRTTSESVYANDITAIGVLNGIYTSISATKFNATSGLPLLSKKAGLSADEFGLWAGASTADISFYQNSLGAKSVIAGNTFSYGFEFWNTCYSTIFTCNSAIEGLIPSSTLTPSIRTQLLGEAKFMRAFCYFFLVNLYGDVPLATTTDYEVNRLLTRSPKKEIYKQIISDLEDAVKLLGVEYLDGTLLKTTVHRVRPTRWAAEAMLARVHLYNENYPAAEAAATNLINNGTNFNLAPLDDVFIANSSEAIWQLQPVNINGPDFWNTEDAQLFVLTAPPIGLSSDKPIYLSHFLLQSFEMADDRLNSWVKSYTDGTGTYYFPYKYKVAEAGSNVTEHLMILRLAEQFLIRAEARAQQNDIPGAQTDLNSIRKRAGLPDTKAADKTSLLKAILRERQIELFSEWGHRWLDIKRTNEVDEVMRHVVPFKTNGAAWSSFKQWYPLPAEDIQRNPNLTQNIGY